MVVATIILFLVA